MAQGLTNRQIAGQLWLSVPTVKAYASRIFARLQAKNRAEAVVIALKHKLVEIDNNC